MRIIIADPKQNPSYIVVKINETNEFGGANTDVIQILKVVDTEPFVLPIYFIGRLCYNIVLRRWMIDSVISNETWSFREEAETALMTNNYTMVDYSDE